MKSKKIIYLLIVFFHVAAFLLHSKSIIFSQTTDTTKATLEERVDKFVNEVSIEDGVGQLLIIGFPYDMYNYEKATESSTIFKDIRPGGFIINKYNVRGIETQTTSKKDINRSIVNFINYLQDKNNETLQKFTIPLFISADFESDRFTSIESGVQLPPSALTLASTKDTKLIKLTGMLVGEQLSKLGINMLLGPVLEVDNSCPGNLNQTLLTRSFAGTNTLVYKLASYYIEGVRHYPISIIGKHFPSNGFNNPHKLHIPEIDCNLEEFKNYYLPFGSFNTMIDGIMTSHASFSLISEEKTPATLSKTIITNLLRSKDPLNINSHHIEGFNLNDKLIITDDLSDMGSILSYKDKFKTTFADIAVKAFAAGHDLLLFSHIEIPKQMQRGRYGKFTINDLLQVKQALIKYIHSNSHAEKQFRQSLKRILICKGRLNSIRHPNDSTFPALSTTNTWNVTTPDLGKFKFIENAGFQNVNAFIQAIHDKATIRISVTNDDYALKDKSPNYAFAVAARPDTINILKPLLNDYKNTTYIDTTSTTSIKKQADALTKLLDGKIQKLYYFMQSVDDKNVIDSITSNSCTTSRNKLVIFLHETPGLLQPKFLTSATIFGNFSQLPEAYKADTSLILGQIQPNDISQLSINIPNFHNASNTSSNIIPASTAKASPEILFDTENERLLYAENQRLMGEIRQLKNSPPTPTNQENNHIHTEEHNRYFLKDISYFLSFKSLTRTYLLHISLYISLIFFTSTLLCTAIRTIFKPPHNTFTFTNIIRTPKLIQDIHYKIFSDMRSSRLLAIFIYVNILILIISFFIDCS